MAVGSTNCVAPAIGPDEVWFDQLLSAPQVTDEQARELAHFAAEVLLDPGNPVRVIPEKLRGDSVPRIVFISLSDGSSTSRVVLGSGKGFGSALEEAFRRAGEANDTGDSPRWLKIDVVKDVSLRTNVNAELPLELPRSLHGLAFDRVSGWAWLPEELVAYTLVNSDQEIRVRNMERYLVKRPPSRDHTFRFAHVVQIYNRELLLGR